MQIDLSGDGGTDDGGTDDTTDMGSYKSKKARKTCKQGEKMTKAGIDKAVCDWSVHYGTAMTKEAQEALVDLVDMISNPPECRHAKPKCDCRICSIGG